MFKYEQENSFPSCSPTEKLLPCHSEIAVEATTQGLLILSPSPHWKNAAQSLSEISPQLRFFIHSCSGRDDYFRLSWVYSIANQTVQVALEYVETMKVGLHLSLCDCITWYCEKATTYIICATPIPSSIRKIDAPQFGAHLTSPNCSHPTNEKGGFMEVANLYKSNTALEIPKAKSEQERKASSCSATSIIVRYFSRHWLRGLMPRYVCFLPSLWCSTKKA